MEFTIDQLAQRVDMSTRNIREWQRQGLIAPPIRRGRVGIYSDVHVARILRVQKLHAEGLPLDLIRRLSASDTESETDIRHLADEVLDPISESSSATLSRRELVERFGGDATAALAAMGLVSADGGRDVVVRDIVTLDLIEELGKVGISAAGLTTALVEVQRHQREIARLVIDVYRDEVWEPFMSSGFTTRDWGTIAEGVAQAKPVAIRLLAHLLDTAFDEVAGAVLLREAAEAERALDDSDDLQR